MRILFGLLLLIEAFVLEWSRPRDPDGLIDALSQYADILVIPFAVMLLLGYKTRWAVVLCWLIYSMRVRQDLLDPDVLVSIGDYILTLGLFWSIFLPLGEHLSLDARGESRRPMTFLSVASGALILQFVVVYLSAGMLKDPGEWITDHTAMETILSIPRLSTPIGTWLLRFPTLLSVLSIATVVLEVVGPLLIIVPGRSLARRRALVVPFFILLHLGISALIGLELFPYVCIAVWLLFLPRRFWDRVWRRFSNEQGSTRQVTDTNRWRAAIVLTAISVAAVSNLVTWRYGIEPEGWPGSYQTVASNLLLYQQWAMFSVPSTLA